MTEQKLIRYKAAGRRKDKGARQGKDKRLFQLSVAKLRIKAVSDHIKTGHYRDQKGYGKMPSQHEIPAYIEDIHKIKHNSRRGLDNLCPSYHTDCRYHKGYHYHQRQVADGGNKEILQPSVEIFLKGDIRSQLDIGRIGEGKAKIKKRKQLPEYEGQQA